MIILKKLKSLIAGMRRSRYPFRYILARVAINTSQLLPFIYIQRHGYRLCLSKSSLISGMISEGPEYLKSQEDLICSILHEGDCFLDVGSNIGNLSLSASANIRNCQVFAIEANRETCTALKKNIRLNNLPIVSINAAASSKDSGSVLISNSFFDDCNCIVDNASFNDATSKARLFGTKQASQPIQQRTLDSLDAQFCWPDKIKLLKIDIEGYELFALKGANRVLDKTQVILLELGESQVTRYGYKRQDVLDFLLKRDFKIYVANQESSSLGQILSHSPLSDALEAPLYCDILAIR